MESSHVVKWEMVGEDFESVRWITKSEYTKKVPTT
jgi:hypothetical protein